VAWFGLRTDVHDLSVKVVCRLDTKLPRIHLCSVLTINRPTGSRCARALRSPSRGDTDKCTLTITY